MGKRVTVRPGPRVARSAERVRVSGGTSLRATPVVRCVSARAAGLPGLFQPEAPGWLRRVGAGGVGVTVCVDGVSLRAVPVLRCVSARVAGLAGLLQPEAAGWLRMTGLLGEVVTRGCVTVTGAVGRTAGAVRAPLLTEPQFGVARAGDGDWMTGAERTGATLLPDMLRLLPTFTDGERVTAEGVLEAGWLTLRALSVPREADAGDPQREPLEPNDALRASANEAYPNPARKSSV